MRPLVMDFVAEKNKFNIKDQFMFGPAFMAAPVIEYGAREREVYFPAGTVWYDFYTGAPVEGGKAEKVAAPYERIPLYVAGGSIVPYGPDMQWSAEKPADLINLYVYTGRDGAFTLYEDEDLNYNYEKGAYAMIPFRWDEATGTLTIGDRQGEFPGMLKDRKFNIVKVSADSPVGFDRQPKGQLVDYSGKAVSVKL